MTSRRTGDVTGGTSGGSYEKARSFPRRALLYSSATSLPQCATATKSRRRVVGLLAVLGDVEADALGIFRGAEADEMSTTLR